MFLKCCWTHIVFAVKFVRFVLQHLLYVIVVIVFHSTQHIYRFKLTKRKVGWISIQQKYYKSNSKFCYKYKKEIQQFSQSVLILHFPKFRLASMCHCDARSLSCPNPQLCSGRKMDNKHPTPHYCTTALPTSSYTLLMNTIWGNITVDWWKMEKKQLLGFTRLLSNQVSVFFYIKSVVCA